MHPETVIAFLSEKFEAEERTGFARLSKVPETHVWQFLEYYRGLGQEEAHLLKQWKAKRAAAFFIAQPFTTLVTESEALAYNRCGNALACMGDYRFMSLKLLKMAVGYCRSEHPRVKAQLQAFQMPEEVVKWVDGFSTCKAPELRRLVKAAFQSRFGLRPEKQGGGVWLYRRPEASSPFEVEIDYGGTWGQQLRYWVHVHEPRLNTTFKRLTYESLLGAGVGDWDFITEAGADQAVALLTDLVAEVAGIPAQLAARAGTGAGGEKL